MSSIVNIAAYQFADLKNLVELRDELRSFTQTEDLRGTILLSPEGINLFVAGSRFGINSLLMRLRSIPGLADLTAKESYSAEQPFNRMLVKIKKEIIAFGVEGIDPRRYTSRRISAHQLKQWLDEGRPVTLLDTRNDFEVEAGTFCNAVAIGVEDFRDFPAAVRRLPTELKSQPIVTFCTGGIRCEKAAPYLEREGFQNVLQLDGGILKYFEECGAAHYRGECFVFDKRVALDPELRESTLKNCFVCRAVLSPEDLLSPHYVDGQSCPNCYLPPAEARSKRIETHQAAICKAVQPLPGSIPHDNYRPLSVPGRLDGVELLDFLDEMRTHLTREEWRAICDSGRLVCRGQAVRPGRIMRAGERVLHLLPADQEPPISADIMLLDEDDDIVVVHKPAPLPMHPCGRFNRNTLVSILKSVFHPLNLRPAHRLDADTSGVVVFSKTRDMARRLQPQFEAGTVSKKYLARVIGTPLLSAFECRASISAEPGPAGVRLIDPAGLPAWTQFRVVRSFTDGTTLLEVMPLTGRTNQIRAHLWELGWPVSGDPIYLPERQLGAARTLDVGDPPLCLHAAEIKFDHPRTGERVCYSAPSPSWTE